jgi:hypothetical protein
MELVSLVSVPTITKVLIVVTVCSNKYLGSRCSNNGSGSCGLLTS